MYARRSRPRRSVRRVRRSKRTNRRVVRRVRKTIAPMETACLKETFSAGNIEPNTPYEPQLSLDMFPRALDVADNYQEYRVSRVEYLYTPMYDTFSALYAPGTSNVQVSLPYLYTKKQTVKTPAAYTLAFLTAQGAKPIRLDDKTIRHKYRPHILQGGMKDVTTGLSVRAVKSPWLSTHEDGTTVMDDTVHYTHNFWVQQDVVNPTASAAVCSLEINVYFEFRKPWDLAAASPPPGAPLKKNPMLKN